MSLAYERATEILNNHDRWVADEVIRLVVVYKDGDNKYCLAEIMNSDRDLPYMSDSVDNTLWFETLEAAKKYAKNEMYVEARFKKAK